MGLPQKAEDIEAEMKAEVERIMAEAETKRRQTKIEQDIIVAKLTETYEA